MRLIFKKIIVTAITWEARLVLARYKPKIVAITGSVGKTSTKDAIFTVFSKSKKVRKSEKSFNSEIGLPLTILGLPNGWNNPVVWIENIIRGFWVAIGKSDYPDWLILEIGAGKPNDIKSVAKWLHPDIVVITRFPDTPVHVEFFGTKEKIIEEKSALAFAVKKDGVLILNHDDEHVYALHKQASSRVVSYGMHDNATYHAIYLSLAYKKQDGIEMPNGLNFKLEYEGNTFPVILPHVLGTHYALSALAALACAHEAGIDPLVAIGALTEYKAPPGRLSYVEGMNQSILIDDTYNASPVATFAALETLMEIKAKRRIAVLGDMLELGKYTEEAHKKVGEEARLIVNILVVVGPRAKFIATGAVGAGFSEQDIHSFDSSIEAGTFLQGIIKKGDAVLLKGSQGTRMERAVKMLMSNPQDAPRILCRQEKEWEKR